MTVEELTIALAFGFFFGQCMVAIANFMWNITDEYAQRKLLLKVTRDAVRDAYTKHLEKKEAEREAIEIQEPVDDDTDLH